MEHRRHERFRLRRELTLSWKDGARIIYCVGNAFDISDFGLLIESPAEIDPGTKVTVKIHGSGLRIETTVRHCRRHGTWYRIGLKSSARLKATID
jgi:hypothetical protein